ncbi:hypothetical protein ACWEMW_31015 [Streptomyces sp. NPDC004684]|uniref:hypothetical protein n=1 Tax=unclassified Streptomyces TaxID=2593676 RepID=UPI0013B5DC9F|nr:hypothetical protein [Streptomyces sp. SID8499]MYX47259.1 hypothetical protein [Streptomyces sp. SID89]NED37181.1 hypothetical protein [Streptomyces sp. SID8499]NED73098.1 hypothetical protein [Streptomyces sp. SID9944]
MVTTTMPRPRPAQLDAVRAVGASTPITWHVAEEETAVAVRNLFADNGVTGIEVVYTPRQ